ncbi:MAG: cell division protein FtsQ/DivIB [Acidimicrobiales bacterium]
MSAPSIAGRRPGPRMDPRLRQRRAAVSRAQGRRRLRVVMAGTAAAVLAVVALAGLHSSLLAARHVKVSGALHTGTAAVLRTAGLAGAPPLIDVNPSAAAARLDGLPWVARATVSRQWPDGVVVDVVERVPVAVVERRGGGVAVVDATGRVLAWDTSPPPGLITIVSPALAGRPGTVMGAAARPALAVAEATAGALRTRVLSVTTTSDGTVELDLGGGVQAVLGSASDVVSKLRALWSVLSGAPPVGPEVIDVSVPGEPTASPVRSSTASRAPA